MDSGDQLRAPRPTPLERSTPVTVTSVHEVSLEALHRGISSSKLKSLLLFLNVKLLTLSYSGCAGSLSM